MTVEQDEIRHLRELVRLHYETRQCPHCGATIGEGGLHNKECPLHDTERRAVMEGGRNPELKGLT